MMMYKVNSYIIINVFINFNVLCVIYRQDDRYPGKFIASSSPDVGREEDFIAMILQRNAKIVVCLEAQVF